MSHRGHRAHEGAQHREHTRGQDVKPMAPSAHTGEIGISEIFRREDDSNGKR